ncbi:MAG: hypothetical protein M1358_15350 [Chloroflexi bacterium]|nr:hypothetical protein [Chloroflexota bacterium]
MDCLDSARNLADYIASLEGFTLVDGYHFGYNHMGAVITDAVLQAGVKYRTVVEPRVGHVLERYPEAGTTSKFLAILQAIGVNIVINWSHPEKPRRLLELTNFLAKADVETVGDLRDWLTQPENCGLLLQIKGIGPKTVDYMKNLVNVPTVAVDRHIRRFVEAAGIATGGYTEVQLVVEFAADLLNVSRPGLDHSIWCFSADKNKSVQG